MSTFNFVYNREHGGPGRGPFQEPPFHVLQHLGDPAWLAQQPQHWFLAPGWNNPFVRPPVLPRKIEPGKSAGFKLDLAPPASGWQSDGRLRIQWERAASPGHWLARFNGEELAAMNDVAEPYPNPYPIMLGRPEEMNAWTVPKRLLKAGLNQLELKLEPGEPQTLNYFDLAAR